jgi:transcriptional regulator with XRE-family HTH domain
MPTLSEILKSKIDKNGKSKTYVASKLGVTEKTIENYINGKRQPKPQALSILAKLLDFDLNSIADSEQFVPDGTPMNIGVVIEGPELKHSAAISAQFLAGRLTGKDELLQEKEARRREAEERAKRAEAANDRLMALLESNLGMLHIEARIGLAYQKAWVEYEAEKASGGDKKKKKEILDRMDRLIREKIQVDPKMDTAASGS